jgi:hypothetical protein
VEEAKVFANDNDRPDMMRERDRVWSESQLNYREFDHKKHEAIARAEAYGTSSLARPLSEIVLEMMAGECYEKLIAKNDVIDDIEVGEAVDEACIVLGFSSESFSPTIKDNGHGIDIQLWPLFGEDGP